MQSESRFWQKLRFQSTEPQFKAGTLRVLVDAVVTDRKGEPVRDLRGGDFEVTDNGVTQAVLSCDFIGAPGPGQVRNAKIPEGAQSPVVEQGPVLLVLDDYQLPPS